MIGREFVKQLRLRHGHIETIRTRFELVANGQLVEHITIETHDRPTYTAKLKSAPAEEGTEAVKRR